MRTRYCQEGNRVCSVFHACVWASVSPAGVWGGVTAHVEQASLGLSMWKYARPVVLKEASSPYCETFRYGFEAAF